jgi:cytochrome c biogenesis protein CcmG/thiol:disulfide interchange protein DsbE
MIARPPLAAALLSIVVAGVGCTGRQAPHPIEGRAMGTLPIVSLDDATLPVPSLPGKVTLLNFWGTWCPPCRRELPGLVRIAGRLADEPRFQLIAVSVGAGGDDEDLARETTSFLSSRQMPIAAWGFSEAVAAAHFSLAYELDGVPTTYLIGPDSRVRRAWNGYRSSDEADMAAAILRLLQEPSLDAPGAAAVTPASRP